MASEFRSWKPHEIAALTPLQFLCLSHEDPPFATPVVRSMQEMEEIERSLPKWEDSPP